MESARECIARMHEYYKTHLDEDPTTTCCGIASLVATCLYREGKNPYIVTVAKIKKDKEGRMYKDNFFPVLFGGRVVFSLHQVCFCSEEDGNKSYDPLIGEPVPIEEYCNSAFGESLETYVIITAEEIKNFLGKK